MLVLVRIFKHDTLSGEMSPDSGISHCILTTKPEGHTTDSDLRITCFVCLERDAILNRREGCGMA